MKAFDASFCNWERDPTLPSASMQGRDATGSAGSVLCHTRSWSWSWHQQPYSLCPFMRCCCFPPTPDYRVISRHRVHLHRKVHPLCQAVVELASVGLLQPGSNAVVEMQQLLHPSAAKPPVHPTMAVHGVELNVWGVLNLSFLWLLLLVCVPSKSKQNHHETHATIRDPSSL